MHMLQISTFLILISSWPQSSPAFCHIFEVSLQHGCLFIQIFMQQLKKIKSQELLDRLFNSNIRQNYYEHHNLPVRNTQRNFMKSASSPVSHKEFTPDRGNKNQIGRQLYPEIIKRVEDPGPGTYDWSTPEAKVYRFTSNPSTKSRKIIQARTREQRVGPGFYKYDNVASMSLLSQNKKTLVTKIVKNPKIQERLTFKVSEVPGPGKYQNDLNINKISSHSEPNSHKISMTARSSLIRKQQLPGPGYYNWDQYFSKNKEKRKPGIEFKFVYGHPS